MPMSIYTLPYTTAQTPDEYRGYVQALWQLQRVRYEINWGLYTGEAWLELDTRNAKRDQSELPRKYRLGVNDIALACNMHAQLLFGEVRDNSDPLVSFKAKGRKGQQASDAMLGHAQDFLDELWGESSSRKLQFQSGISSQVTGGTFWRVRYAPHRGNPFDLYPFKFEPILADYMFPVFASGSDRMNEVFVRYQISREAAHSEWGAWSKDWPDLVEYREHWTRELLTIHVGVEGLWREVRVERNPFGFVPFVYIPHLLSNGFFGIPLAEWAGAVDLAEEYNSRLANTGDIVRQNSYPFGVLKNHPTGKLKPPFRMWKDGPTVMDLGPGLPGERAPELDWFDPSEVTGGTMTYLDTLKKELRMAMAIPPVAMGEDEGSQRSSLTLITRMFPVKSHVLTERWLWTSAMIDLNRMALQMAKIKRIEGLEDLNVAGIGITPNWAPMLPRDRAELVNELVQRAGVGHVHPADALEQYEDTPLGEVEETYARIREHQEWAADLTRQEVENVPAQPVSQEQSPRSKNKR